MIESTQPDFTTPLKVVASFNYTIDDLREGLAPPEVEKKKKRGSWHRTIFGWVLFVGLTMMLLVLLQQNRGTPPRFAAALPATEPARVDLKFIVVPSATAAVCFTLFIIGLVMTARWTGAKSKALRDRASMPTFVAAFACVFLCIGSSWLSEMIPAIEVDPARAPMNLIAFAPWIAMLLIALAVILLSRGKALERQWNSKPSYQRRRTITLNDEGVRNVDEMGENFYRWPYFKRAWEKPSVLVLIDEADLRHILPKRAFEEVGGLDTARALIGSNIAESKFLTQPVGFPVRPIAVPPPIPRA